MTSGNVASEYSAIELALTYAFTDSTLTPGATTVKLAHLSELRSAANAVRAVVGLSTVTWAEPTPALIRASHLTELRSAIADVRAYLALPAMIYTDSGLVAGNTVKAIHVDQLRAAMR